MILKDLIIKKPLLRIQQLNGRIESFCYGPMETFNKLSLIKETGFSDMNDIKQSGKFLMIMMWWHSYINLFKQHHKVGV